MKKNIVEIKDLSKTYKGASHPSVDGLNMYVREGEFFGLLGPNGAGKTTTLSILWGLRTFNHGTVMIQGKNVKNEYSSIKPNIGIVPQDIALYPELTVEENLNFIGKVYTLSNLEREERIAYYLHAFGIEPQRRKKVSYLSGGMKRQVNLIAALLHTPKILFLDEPTVGVDVQSRQSIVANLKQLNQDGMTIIYTSHDLHEAEQLCTYVALINKGKIVCEGKPTHLICETNVSTLEQLFIDKTFTSE